ncbi:MAG: hypothetical protein K6G48_04185 [Acholeplasmatales bacterium]|nr:hypothetical protein [Acholeplasmatales bacterium]
MKKAEFIVSLTLLIVNAIALIALFIVLRYYHNWALYVLTFILCFIEVGLVLTIFNFYQNYKDNK